MPCSLELVCPATAVRSDAEIVPVTSSCQPHDGMMECLVSSSFEPADDRHVTRVVTGTDAGVEVRRQCARLEPTARELARLAQLLDGGYEDLAALSYRDKLVAVLDEGAVDQHRLGVFHPHAHSHHGVVTAGTT